MNTEEKYGGLPLAQLEAIERAATPGPWWMQHEYDGGRTICAMRSSDLWCINRADHVVEQVPPREATKENGALISAARNALPDLIAKARHAEAGWREAELQRREYAKVAELATKARAEVIRLTEELQARRAEVKDLLKLFRSILDVCSDGNPIMRVVREYIVKTIHGDGEEALRADDIKEAR